jgi:3D (Asp-Asp-Asp) domain-containing protein
MTFKNRHLNPKIKKAFIYCAIIGLAAISAISYYDSRQAMAEASIINAEAQDKLDRYDESIRKYQDEIRRLKEANSKLLEEREQICREVNRGYSRELNVEVTAYTLSEASCNKGADHPSYGLTANGTDLSGHTLESARAIAVDPGVIPLGSKVRIAFEDEEMHQYNGIYTACDTGGAIKENMIDLFVGEDAEALAEHIGRRQAKIQILS